MVSSTELPGMMNSPTYRPNGGPHGVLGAVGTRRLGTVDSMKSHGVTITAEQRAALDAERRQTEHDRLMALPDNQYTHEMYRKFGKLKPGCTMQIQHDAVDAALDLVARDGKGRDIDATLALAQDEYDARIAEQGQFYKERLAQMDAQPLPLPETKPPAALTLYDVWAKKMKDLYGENAGREFARATSWKNWHEAKNKGTLTDAEIAAMLEKHTADAKRAADLDEVLGPDTPPEPVAQKPAEKAPQSDATPAPVADVPAPRSDAPTAPVAAILGQITTLTGIGAAEISKRMNGRFPAAAYEPIPYGPMKGKTDLSFDYVRDRFDEVFGPHGLGWKMEPHAVMGKVEHIEVEEQRKDGGTRRVHMVAMEMFVFKYRVVMPDGNMEWIESSPLSDCDDNEDRGYAYRGAWTSLLKQTLRSFGGINHILRNEYTHVQAQQQGRRAA